MALLGKWKWWFLNEPDCLRSRVIKAKCVEQSSSPWWKGINSACVMEGWNWFDVGIQKTVLEGNDTQFCGENWVGNGPLEF